MGRGAGGLIIGEGFFSMVSENNQNWKLSPLRNLCIKRPLLSFHYVFIPDVNNPTRLEADCMARPQATQEVVLGTGKSIYVGGTLLSIVLSLALYLSGKRETGIFVGLWDPTILDLGQSLVEEES